jgi:uncharacterized oxidoreductase
MTIHIPADALTDFCAEIFARVGCRSDEARRVSASLVDANLTGHDSHGVIRVPRYVDAVREGALIPNQSIERIVDTPVIGVVDGRFGFGQTMAPMAVDIGVEKAKAMGLSAISLRNSGHVGRVGEWAERAGRLDLDPFRQRRRLDPGRAVRRIGPSALDRAVLRRHSARRRRARRA